MHIGPAIGSNGGIIKRGLGPRAHSTLGGSSLSRTAARIDSPSIPKDNTVMVDRISLDR